ncbi:unnamed protein product [Camellia sinensis]
MIISFLFRFSSSSLVTKLRNLRVLGPGKGMPQDDQLGLTRRSRRVYRSGGDRDDRGWTVLHIGARKGDLKEVLEWAQVQKIMRGIASDLDHIHTRATAAIIHGDLKPDNILLGQDYSAIICDFGSAIRAEDQRQSG